MYAPTYRIGPLLPDERTQLQITADMLLARPDANSEQIAHALNAIADGASTSRYQQVITQIREYMRETIRRSDPEYWLASTNTDDYALGADMIQVWVSENIAATLQLRTITNILGNAQQRITQKTPVTA